MKIFIYILNRFTYAITLGCGNDNGGNYVKYVKKCRRLEFFPSLARCV